MSFNEVGLGYKFFFRWTEEWFLLNTFYLTSLDITGWFCHFEKLLDACTSTENSHELLYSLIF